MESKILVSALGNGRAILLFWREIAKVRGAERPRGLRMNKWGLNRITAGILPLIARYGALVLEKEKAIPLFGRCLLTSGGRLINQKGKERARFPGDLTYTTAIDLLLGCLLEMAERVTSSGERDEIFEISAWVTRFADALLILGEVQDIDELS